MNTIIIPEFGKQKYVQVFASTFAIMTQKKTQLTEYALCAISHLEAFLSFIGIPKLIKPINDLVYLSHKIKKCVFLVTQN